MATTMEAPANCEIRSMIRFLQAAGQNATEIHRRLCIVYGENVISGAVRKWYRHCREGRTDVYDEGVKEGCP